jgi:hypothetical protein
MARWGTVCVGAAAVALVVAVSGTVAFEQQPAPTLGAAQARLQANDPEGAAAILGALIGGQPGNVQAYRLLGTALRRTKKFDEALAAYMKALELQPGHPSTFYNMGVLWALQGDEDKAFDFLDRAKATKIFDMSVAEGDPELASIRNDARFKAVLPQPDDFKDPFVEPVKIVAEWVGESANDQFGWIARSIGDVDGDKIADFVTSAPALTSVIVSRSPSASVSLPSRSLRRITTGVSSAVVTLSLFATGAALVRVTVMETVAVAVRLPSLTV